MNIQQLQARRAELLEELARVEDAIKAAGDSSPVRVRTWCNIRNTGLVVTDPADVAREELLVFANEELTERANPASHEGFVSREAWTQFILAHPWMLEGDMPLIEELTLVPYGA